MIKASASSPTLDSARVALFSARLGSAKPRQAQVAKALKVYCFPEYGKPFANVLGNLDVIKRLMMKIDNPFAPYAFEVLVILQVAVKPFGIAGALNDKRRPDVAESQQRPVDGIQRYIGQHRPYFLKDLFG
jgi:hypothetical protein